MIDANANRAREALRTLEDIARFALNDHGLCARLKDARHELAAALEDAGIDALGLLASRDTPGDAGTAVEGAREGTRASLAEIAGAGAGRLSEALRVIEECLKVGGHRPGAWMRVEAVRYAVYELDRTLRLALGTGRCPQWRLCVLVSESLCPGRDWRRLLLAVIEGGADCLQLREPGMGDGALLQRAREFVAAAHAAASRPAVIINNRPDVALLAGADGVHLGQGDLPVAAVRELAGSRLLVGVSTHDEAEARRAIADGADYCGVGAMFMTSTKPREASGPDYLRRFLEIAGAGRAVPHLAIGGITPDNVGTLVRAGCRGVAVSAGVCSASDPARACREILRQLN
jgi:thiamine-phosphate pyrophosphorylase